jgi:hypothetical protein
MDVIKFLENAGGAPIPDAAYLAAVEALDVGQAERDALIARDGIALGKLLGGRDKMYCSVLAPERDVPEEAPDAPTQPEPGSPDDDPAQ